ncbi:MAG: ketopantoate reductase C-terminal domain-containing protein [Cyanobacteria bacterium P01_F01_bin.53]
MEWGRSKKTARQVPEHYSSTYQDVMSGRPSEIDFLNRFPQ